MKKVIRSRVLGFCMGVRRAVNLAFGEAQRSAGKVYTLGPLIHNSQVLDELKLRGLDVLDVLPDNLYNASVIIRAHGLSPETEAELKRRGAALVDATCPRVKTSQLKAQALAEAGYDLFLAGEKTHAEISGIRGYAESGAACRHDEQGGSRPFFLRIVSSAAEAGQAAAELHVATHGNAQTALIGQTTISPEEYQAIGEAITRYFPDLEIAQTICAATRERQDSLRELVDQVEAIIIAGGKDSANTRRLLLIAEAAGKPCALVETAADIPPEFYAYQTIGLAAGASTPDSVIDAIERTLGGIL